MYQIARGIKAIHDVDIMHRDLKPENFFLTKEIMVKLGDFGEAKVLDKGNVTG
jgi:NIMA (never in mitosis gene a)-related kinase